MKLTIVVSRRFGAPDKSSGRLKEIGCGAGDAGVEEVSFAGVASKQPW